MKIGFIAMSGVRVQNRELIALGLNLPGFVERSEVIASLPSLGLLTLAGMTPPHIDVAYLAEHADAVVVGEAEAVWSAVIRDLDPPPAGLSGQADLPGPVGFLVTGPPAIIRGSIPTAIGVRPMAESGSRVTLSSPASYSVPFASNGCSIFVVTSSPGSSSPLP